MQALIAGSPPAVSANLKEFGSNPAAKLIQANAGLLKQAGMGFYRSLSGDLGVIFNQFHVHPEDIQAADKAGKLSLIAPPFDTVNHAISKSGLRNPVLRPQGGAPTALAPASLKAPPQISAGLPGPLPPGATPAAPPMVRPPPASVQTKLMAARAKNLSPGSPSSGPVPGAGRLLNQILTPTV
jgi:hypothetical protein